MKWEGEDEGVDERKRERKEKRNREKKSGDHSHGQLCPKTIALFPHLQQVNRQLLLCAYILPFSLSSSHTLTSSLMTQYMNRNK